MKQALLLILTLLSINACSVIHSEQTLFQQLNGKTGIERIVNSFIQHIANDKQVFAYFAKASVSHFRQGFITHLCAISGGPCVYDGDSMVDIHTGMKITEGDFNRIVELLIEALEENQISYSTQNQVLALLVPLRKDIIKI